MKIKRPPKKGLVPSAQESELIQKLLTVPDDEIPDILSPYQSWEQPRSDLYLWIDVLNRFDSILEEIVKSYDVTKLQTNDFTPRTRDLLLSVLRFSSLLVENSTNRRLWNSQDRINELLLSRDIEVVQQSLRLALPFVVRKRISAEHRSEPPAHDKTWTSLEEKTAILAQGWNTSDHGLEITDLAKEDVVIPTELSQVTFNYYKKAGVGGTKDEGGTTVGANASLGSTITKEGVEERTASSIAPSSASQVTPARPKGKGKERSTPFQTPTTAATSATGTSSQSEGLVTLELGDVRNHGKPAMDILADVLETHPIPKEDHFKLLQTIRVALAIHDPQSRKKLLIVRLLAIAVWTTGTHRSFSHSPLFMYEPDLTNRLSELVRPERKASLEIQTAALYALRGVAKLGKVPDVANAINASMNHGITVNLLKNLVHDLDFTNRPAALEYTDALFTLLERFQYLGNTVFVPLMPAFVKIIKHNRGERLPIATRAIQLIDTQIPIGPTILGPFCSAGGPAAYVEALKTQVDLAVKTFTSDDSMSIESRLDPTISGRLPFAEFQFLKSILRSILKLVRVGSALEGLRNLIDSSLLACLKTIVKHRTIFGPVIFAHAINLAADFVNVEPTSFAAVQESGLLEAFYSAIEEHIEPSLDVLNAIPEAIRSFCLTEQGLEYSKNRVSFTKYVSLFLSEPHVKVLQSKDTVNIGAQLGKLYRHYPLFQKPILDAVKSMLEEVVKRARAYEETTTQECYLVVPSQEADTASEAAKRGALEEKEKDVALSGKRDDGPMLAHVDAVISFLDAFVREMEISPNLEFLSKTVLPMTCELRTLSLRSSTIEINRHARAHLMQRLSHHIPSFDILSHLFNLIKSSPAQSVEEWLSSSLTGGSRYLQLLSPSSPAEVNEANTILRKLTSFRALLGLVNESCRNVLSSRRSFENKDALFGIIKVDEDTSVLARLGELQKAILVDTLHLFLKINELRTKQTNKGKAPTEQASSTSTPASGPSGETSSAKGVEGGKASVAAETDAEVWKRRMTMSNAEEFGKLVKSTGDYLTSLFDVVAKMLPGSAARPDEMTPLSKFIIRQLAQVMLRQCQIPENVSGRGHLMYATYTFGWLPRLLSDVSRSTQVVRPRLLAAFIEIGGLDAVNALVDHYVDVASQLPLKPHDKLEQTEREKYLSVNGGLQVALSFLQFLCNAESIPSVTDGAEVPLAKHELTIQLRASFVPSIRRIWDAPWLPFATPSVVRLTSQTLLTIMEGAGEESPTAPSPPKFKPDESLIAQIMEMGFSRSSARRALRIFNNSLEDAVAFCLERQANQLDGDDAETEEDAVEAAGRSADVEMADAGGEDNANNAATSSDSAKGTIEVARDALQRSREDLRSSFTSRAIEVGERHATLVFDIKRGFDLVLQKEGKEQETERAAVILDTIQADIEKKTEGDTLISGSDDYVKVRLTLLALVIGQLGHTERLPSQEKLDSILSLLLRLAQIARHAATSDKPAPDWVAPLFLTSQSVLFLNEVPDPGDAQNVRTNPGADARRELLGLAVAVLHALRTPAPLGSQELLSAALRCVVFVTRSEELVREFIDTHGGVNLLLSVLASNSKAGDYCQVLAIMVFRHIAEDTSVLRDIISQDVRRFLSEPGTKAIHALVTRHAAAISMRHPIMLRDVVTTECRLVSEPSNNDPGSAELGARDDKDAIAKSSPSPANKESEGPNGSSDLSIMQVDGPLNSESKPATLQLTPEALRNNETLIHTLMAALLSPDAEIVSFSIYPLDAAHFVPVAKPNSEETTQHQTEKPSQTTDETKAEEACRHHLFVLTSMVELLSSYEACKASFLGYGKAQADPSSGPPKLKSSFLRFLLGIYVDAKNPTAPTASLGRRARVAAVAKEVLLALAAEPPTSNVAKGDPAPIVTGARKVLLDNIAKAVRDALSSSDPIAVRYPRLQALAELANTLLAPPPPTSRMRSDEQALRLAPEQFATLMAEKDFVSLWTNAIGDLDINFPQIQAVLAALLRPLERLTDLGKRASRANPAKDPVVAGAIAATLPFDDFEDDEDEGDDEDEEIMEMDEHAHDDEEGDTSEAPDLYSSSALGMYSGELDLGNSEDAYLSSTSGEGDEDEEDDAMELMEEEDASDVSDESEDEDRGDEMMDADGEIIDDGDDGIEIEEEDVGDDEEGLDLADELGVHPEAHLHAEFAVEEEDVDEGEEDDEEDGGEEVMGDEDHDGLESEADDGVYLQADLEEEGDPGDYDDEEPVLVDDLDVGMGGFGERLDILRDTTRMMEGQGIPDLQAHPFNAAGGHHPFLLDLGDYGRRAISRQPRLQGVLPFEMGRLLDRMAAAIPTDSFQRAMADVNRLMSGGQFGSNQVSVDMIDRGVVVVRGVENGRSGGLSHMPRLDSDVFSPAATFSRWREAGDLFQPPLRPSAVPARRTPRLTRLLFESLRPAYESRKAAEDARRREETRLKQEAEAREAEPAEPQDTTTQSDTPQAIQASTVEPAGEAPPFTDAVHAEDEVMLDRADVTAEDTTMVDVDRRNADEPVVESQATASVADAAQAMESVSMDDILADAHRPPTGTVETPAPAEPAVEVPPVAQAETAPTAPTAEPVQPPVAGPSTAERVTVMIDGNPVDITDTGIDPTFLEALPEDMRQEVLNQHFRETRITSSLAAVPSSITPEFLDALPPEIRADVIRQERMQQEARDRETRGAQQGEAQSSGPVELDLASFLATLDPAYRREIMVDLDDMTLSQLPPDIVAEAEELRERTRMTAIRRRADTYAASGAGRNAKPSPPAEAVQLIDKSGVAILIRLLFLQSSSSSKSNVLQKTLVNLSQNSSSRTDILNQLLTILQDAAYDPVAVSSYFSQSVVRPQKGVTPRPTPKRRSTLINVVSPLLQIPTHRMPVLVAQRCLEALLAILRTSEAWSHYFLSEQEVQIIADRRASRKDKDKGKGKEKGPASTICPIVILLGLLDRPAFLQSPVIMELLTGLLAHVLRGLDALKQPSAETSRTPADAPNPEGATPASTTAAASTSEPTRENGSGEGTSKGENAASLQKPPEIPPHILRLVANVLDHGECSSKTFRQTLSIFQRLCTLPYARQPLLDDLKERAEKLGKTIEPDLLKLYAAVTSNQTFASINGSVVANFSSAASAQAKLLRILQTIDHLRTSTTKQVTAAPQGETQPPLSGDAQVAATTEGHAPASGAAEGAPSQSLPEVIFDELDFGSLWKRLSDVLAEVGRKPDLSNLSTVLLPLIESLMIVSKSKPTAKPSAGNQATTAVSPRGADSGTLEALQALFVDFTQRHRSILNLLVRNNPPLMSGPFAVLARNPGALDFDNKRNYFHQQLSKSRPQHAVYRNVRLSVRRDEAFEDSFIRLRRKTGDEFKYQKFVIQFEGEEGVDAGGLYREWLVVIARQMFNPNYALFEPCANDKLTYQPKRGSYINPMHLEYFHFVGRIIGKAIFDGKLFEAYFTRSFYKHMLGQRVHYTDLEAIDPEYYKSLVWMLENDIEDYVELTFSVEPEEFGKSEIIDLKPNGRNIPVTNENKMEYVNLVAEQRLTSAIKSQIDAFLRGFHEVIPADLIKIFSDSELELLISGLPNIDVDEWRANTDYQGYSPSAPVITWFWRAVRSFGQEQRAKLLQFVTGSSRVPLEGFGALQGVQGETKFTLVKAHTKNNLPSAHTCFNQIDLPEYDTYEDLRAKLMTAITEGYEGFGFA